ncbi:response regulator [Paenibacillus sp. GCM10027626]|uniref:response regulator n=1 Tax=Paenibacillus sp. GCM10027626 TaxID=3273411 RepID=UPI003630BF73
MYRLLIVDDEPFIVDSLCTLIAGRNELELDIYKAYAADEALAMMEQIEADIILTDIRMPGMDGIELQQKVIQLYPHCKVIFLTGYDDFDYVQSAIRGGGVDYILKMEGFEFIIAALERAIAGLRASGEKTELLRRASEQLEDAKPMLQRDFITGLLEGTCRWKEEDAARLQELGVSLQTKAPVALMIGSVDNWPEGHSAMDRKLLLYAVQNIAEEHFREFFSFYAMPFDRSRIVWILQSREERLHDWPSDQIESLTERIQETCKLLLGLSLSFAVGSRSAGWASLPVCFERLLKLLQRRIGPVGEMIVTDRSIASDAPAGGEAPGLWANAGKVKALQEVWERGTLDDFRRIYDEIWGDQPRTELPVHVQKEIYYTLAAHFMTLLSDWELAPELQEAAEVERMMQMETHRSWEELDQYFLRLARCLLDYREQEREKRSFDFIHRLHSYIDHHLGDDLSLNRLGEIVYLNASYLSRVYKQLTGVGLTDYITDTRIARAKQLLADPGLKIHEVSVQVGFESPSYFGQVFKRKTAMTPQEYREAWC